MDDKYKIKDLSERLITFFQLFDALFLEDAETKDLLQKTKESLKNKISHNESALVVIAAMGGHYDGAIDRAKCKEVDALLELINARNELKKATINESRQKDKHELLLKQLFGI